MSYVVVYDRMPDRSGDIAAWQFCRLQMQDIALCQCSNKVISPIYFGIILLLLVHSPSRDFLRKSLNSKVVKI